MHGMHGMRATCMGVRAPDTLSMGYADGKNSHVVQCRSCTFPAHYYTLDNRRMLLASILRIFLSGPLEWL